MRVQTYIYNIIKIYLREYPLSPRGGFSQDHIIFFNKPTFRAARFEAER